MPTPGVARNPLAQRPTRFRQIKREPVTQPARSPVLAAEAEPFERDLAPGTFRRVWRQAINLIRPADPISWSENYGQGTVTRALRYKAASSYRGAGSDNTRFGAPRPIRSPLHRQLRPTLSAGNKRNLPTVRNRMASFGSRVPTLNQAIRPR